MAPKGRKSAKDTDRTRKSMKRVTTTSGSHRTEKDKSTSGKKSATEVTSRRRSHDRLSTTKSSPKTDKSPPDCTAKRRSRSHSAATTSKDEGPVSSAKYATMEAVIKRCGLWNAAKGQDRGSMSEKDLNFMNMYITDVYEILSKATPSLFKQNCGNANCDVNVIYDEASAMTEFVRLVSSHNQVKKD